jgi:hypothetical protein
MQAIAHPLSTFESDAAKNDALTNDQVRSVFRCQFWRIDDNSFRNIQKQSYSIHEQWPSYYLMHADNDQNNRKNTFNLAEYFAAMCILFGEPGNCFDDWKGAFSFPFEVQVFKRGQYFKYGLNVINWRSTVELRFCKVVDQNDKNTNLHTYRHPIESEFSEREMIVLDNLLCGCILGIKRSFRVLNIPAFIKRIDSNLIIFGYVDGEFFEHQHETEETYKAEVDKRKYLNATNATAICWPEPVMLDVINVAVELDQYPQIPNHVHPDHSRRIANQRGQAQLCHWGQGHLSSPFT